MAEQEDGLAPHTAPTLIEVWQLPLPSHFLEAQVFVSAAVEQSVPAALLEVTQLP